MSTFSRAKRRRLNTATTAAEKMTEADAKFFDRFPDRSHRVRLASRAEMEANALINGVEIIPTDPGQSWYCAVKQIAPGVRVRVFLQNDVGTETDMPEWQAEYCFSLVAAPGSQARLIERQIQAVLAKRGAA